MYLIIFNKVIDTIENEEEKYNFDSKISSASDEKESITCKVRERTSKFLQIINSQEVVVV